MANTVKTAISLPVDVFKRAEADRRRFNQSRSEYYVEALQAHLKTVEIRELEKRYVEGYRRIPETWEQERW